MQRQTKWRHRAGMAAAVAALLLTSLTWTASHAMDAGIDAHGCLRVRVLEKHHPRSIEIRNPYRKTLHIDKSSHFPIVLSSSKQYTLDLAQGDNGGRRTRRYTGAFRIDWSDDELVIVNQVPLEDYVLSVVLSEMGFVHAEAMKAQAILARTWALSHRRPARAYDFGDLTNAQVYRGLFPVTERARQRIVPANGRILTYGGEPVDVFYHAACSDRRFSADRIWGSPVPYLNNGPLPFLITDGETVHLWERTFSKSTVDRIFTNLLYTDADQPLDLDYQTAGRNGQLGVAVGDRWIGVDDFRLALNRTLGWHQIKSNDFVVTKAGGNLVFKGKGFGHLVGLCQEQAVVLAENGYTWRDIIGLFYQGCDIVQMR